VTSPHFDHDVLNTLGEAVRDAGESLRIIVSSADPDDELGGGLTAVAREVEEGTGGAVPSSVVGGDTTELTVRFGERTVATYRAAPVGPEAAPFVSLLQTLAIPSDDSVPHVEQAADIVVYISPDCPNCPRSVQAATQLAAVNPEVTATVVDIGRYADEVASLGIRSVPAAIVNDGLTLVGAMSAAEMAEKIAGVAGQTTEDQVLASLVDAGRIDAAAAMLAEGTGHAGFVDLWRKSTLESRMGLVLGAESALETDPRSLDLMVPDLLQVLDTDDAARRGDTADLLGMIGHPSARNRLEALLEDSNEDVAEIAGEALEALRQEADPQ
jgi:hypothetical protein